MSEVYDFTVLGGDLRQVHLARCLSARGYRICTYALCASPDPEGVLEAHTLADAVRCASCILAPIPLAADRDYLNQKAGKPSVLLSELFSLLTPGQRLYAGCIPESLRHAASEAGAWAIDLMEQEELAIFNACATAEGAIAEAIFKSPRNLHKSHSLILGGGKCAKALALRLTALGSRVTVCAKNPIQLAEADLITGRILPLPGLEEALPEADFIFNTIPALILDARRLKQVQPEACILDIASAPGGVDFEAALRLEKSAWLLPGLPGRVSPASSGVAIADFILRHCPRSNMSLEQEVHLGIKK